MNNETFILLSKFTVSARKVAGSINPSKLMTDKHYANEVFWKINQIGDEALIMMSLEIQHQLGMLSPTDKQALPVIAEKTVTDNKYIFGARS